MEVIFNLLIINFICVGVIDYLGFVEEGLTPLVRKLTGSKIGHIGKPWSCSTCLTFWVSAFYILVTGNFTLGNVALCLGAAMLSPVTLDLINLVRDLLSEGITWIYRILNI